MEELYLLSYLLTAHPLLAEQCYAAGMQDCVEGSPVFKEWAHAWSRRAIVKNSIRMLSPLRLRPDADASKLNAARQDIELPPALDAVIKLEPLERFVYVMSVLERYSDHECAILLVTTKKRVAAGRTRALQQVALSHGASLPPLAILSRVQPVAQSYIENLP